MSNKPKKIKSIKSAGITINSKMTASVILLVADTKCICQINLI